MKLARITIELTDEERAGERTIWAYEPDGPDRWRWLIGRVRDPSPPLNEVGTDTGAEVLRTFARTILDPEPPKEEDEYERVHGDAHVPVRLLRGQGEA